MKNYDSRTYSINDFLEWNNNKQLELNPKFQRKSVWTDTARSFLMDTIIRGLPIPKIFIRQKINVTTRNSIREVVDGQQRLRTILSFLNDGFKISKKHNPKYGGYYFSQLNEIDDDIQASILNYEISVDLLVNMPDPDVLDVFSRLNSYAVVLNDQERINANHFGTFKLLADSLSKEFYNFWIDNGILTPQKCLRMEDVSLTADLLIAMCTGIKEKKKIKFYYDAFEENFEYDADDLANKFRSTISLINKIFDNGLRQTEFRRVHILYTLFTSLYHILYGIPGMNPCTYSINPNDTSQIARIAHALERVSFIYQADEDTKKNLPNEDLKFLEDSRRATTDASKRLSRTEFVIDLIVSSDQ